MAYPDPSTVVTEPATGIPYFTPKQPKPSGTARHLNSDTPTLFQPLQLSSTCTIPNRIGVSPMCTYSASQGLATPFHVTHYGGFALRGPGLVITESVAVCANGRITPLDLGVYTEPQIEKLKKVVDFYHSQNKVIGVQLSHAGFKASELPLFYGYEDYPLDNPRGGWLDDVWGPSVSDTFTYSKELSIDQIHEIVGLFDKAVKDSIERIGFDFVEIHAGHGFLISQFLSPATNKRNDEFGGCLENRTKFLFMILENIKRYKAQSDLDFPVFVRISASDNNESDLNTWRLQDSLELAPLLIEKGVNVIDVSSGGNVKPKPPRFTHWEMARQIKQKIKSTKGLVAAVRNINDGKTANELLDNGSCDICLSATGFLKNPNQVELWADQLSTDIQMSLQLGFIFKKVW